MTDYSEFQHWCDAAIKGIMLKLGVTLYEIKWDERLPIEDDTLFEIDARYPYQYAHVKYSHRAYEKWLGDANGVVSDLVHEVFHIIVAPLSHAAYERHATGEMISNAEEEVVDRLSNAFEHLTKF